jgi:Flp pilus assembly protein TadB
MSALVIIESLIVGMGAAWLASEAIRSVSGHKRRGYSMLEAETASRFRRNQWYAAMESRAAQLAQWNREWLGSQLKSLRNDYSLSLPAAEAVAVWQLQGAFAACGVFLLMRLTGSGIVASLFVSFIFAAGLLFFRFRQSYFRATKTRRQIRARLPYAIELIALLLDTGGGLTMDAFRTAARDNQYHPIGRLLRDLISRVDDGSGFSEALVEWAKDFDDPDLSNVAVVIRTSEEKGAPLHDTLRALAEQLRIRRLEQLEAAAEQAKVHMTGPVFVVVISCLIVAAAPLSLTALEVLKDVPLFDLF